MNLFRAKTSFILLLLVAATGCQHLSTDAALAEVRSDVSQRLNIEVRWNSTESSDCSALTKELLSKELTANNAVQLTLLNNRGLRADFENIGIAQAELAQAGRLQNPRLEATYRPPVSSGPAATASLDLSQRFLDLILMPMRKKVAAAQFEACKSGVTVSILRLAGQATSAFFEAQAAEQMCELRKSIVDATGASEYAAEKLHAAGNITKLDLNRERDQHDQAKLDLSESEISIVESREHLNELMGLSGLETTVWKIGNRLPEVPVTEIELSDFENHAIERNAELVASRQSIEAFSRERGIADISPALSSLELGVSSAREDNSVWHVGPSLSLELPIFDQGGARRAKVQAEIRKALEQHAALVVNVHASIRTAIARLTKNRERCLFLHNQILPRRAEIVDDTQKQYNAMQVGVFQLLQAKRDQIDAGRQYIECLRDYWLARSSIELLAMGVSDASKSSSEATAHASHSSDSGSEMTRSDKK